MVPTWIAATTTQITEKSSQSFCQSATLRGEAAHPLQLGGGVLGDLLRAHARGLDLLHVDQRLRRDVRRDALPRLGELGEQLLERLQRARQLDVVGLDAALEIRRLLDPA